MNYQNQITERDLPKIDVESLIIWALRESRLADRCVGAIGPTGTISLLGQQLKKVEGLGVQVNGGGITIKDAPPAAKILLDGLNQVKHKDLLIHYASLSARPDWIEHPKDRMEPLDWVEHADGVKRAGFDGRWMGKARCLNGANGMRRPNFVPVFRAGCDISQVQACRTTYFQWAKSLNNLTFLLRDNHLLNKRFCLITTPVPEEPWKKPC